MPMTRANRFGVSVLSKKNQGEALNEELLSKKELGLNYIKAPDGYVISFDKMAREKGHIDSVTHMAYNLDVVGKMFSVDIPNTEMPEIIDIGTNIVPTEGIVITEYITDRPSHVFISVDLEAIEIQNTDAVLSVYQPYVSCTLAKVNSNNVTIEEVTITNKPLKYLNSHVWDLVKDGMDANVVLKSLTFVQNPDKPENVTLMYVLYGIISVFKRRWI